MSYHGATMGALAMTGRPGIRHDYLPYLNAFPHIESPITFRGPLRGLDAKEAALRAASRLSDTIENEGPETVAAFIAEPISASRGEALAPDGYWTLIREICDRYGILFIADEIVTGVGRTGGLLCFSHFGIKPDLTTLAKGLGAGYTPLGATLVSDRVADTIAEGGREMQELHTYSGNPLSCAVGVAVLDIIEKEGLLEVAEPKGTYAGQLMDEYLGDLPWFGERRGMGLLRGVEWVRSRETRDPFAKELDVANKLWAGMWRHGVVMGSLRHDNPLVGDFTVLSPALTVSEADLEHGIKVLREVAVEVMGAS
jgi:adenosylmethionine-8-amino-7-oxononanoate aminotransferase